jgi:hypothetical protein
MCKSVRIDEPERSTLMARIPARETTRKPFERAFGGEFDKSELMREAIRLIVEETLEAEVSEHL